MPRVVVDPIIRVVEAQTKGYCRCRLQWGAHYYFGLSPAAVVSAVAHQGGGGCNKNTAGASFSSSSSVQEFEFKPQNNNNKDYYYYYYIAAAAAVATGSLAAVGVYTRNWRETKIERELPLLQMLVTNQHNDELHITDPRHKDIDSSNSSNSSSTGRLARNLTELRHVVQRAGLMGQTQKSVKAELEDIRKWHIENGYKGGLVVRDVTVPLFFGTEQPPSPSSQHDNDEDSLTNSTSTSNADNKHNTDTPSEDPPTAWNFWDWFPHPAWSWEALLEDPMRLARRECYYLYYEIQPTGRHVQQVFCRGTTLGVDILTCLQAWTVYDKELQCRVHRGFRDQADRVVTDLLPLLAPPHHERATVELAGHSLGGAVAAIVAGKLRQRGYRVVRLTTVGEPAYVATYRDAQQLRQLLPKDHLRVENDRDFVPFLPPTAMHVGDKLWFPNFDSLMFTSIGRVSKGGTPTPLSQPAPPPTPPPRFVTDSPENRWTESFWLNFCVPEILLANGKPHRIPSYLERLDALTTTSTDREGNDNGTSS